LYDVHYEHIDVNPSKHHQTNHPTKGGRKTKRKDRSLNYKDKTQSGSLGGIGKNHVAKPPLVAKTY
jgi:hypothetical protein